MENFKLDLITDADLEEIDSWKKTYRDNEEFTKIIYYIMGGMSSDIKGLLKNLHDKNPIGENELNLVLAAKENDEVVGAIVADMFDRKTKHPELYIHFIFTKPTYQSKGVGKKMLTELFLNLTKYFKTKPQIVFANIDKTNIASQKLFSKFGLLTSGKETYGSNLAQFKADYNNILTLINLLEKEQ